MFRLGCDVRADAAEHPAHQQREQRREQEEDEGLGQDGRGEIAASDDEGRADEALHFTGSCGPMAAAALFPAMATKASWSPGRSIASVSIPAAPSISALSRGSGPPSGSSKTHSSP